MNKVNKILVFPADTKAAKEIVNALKHRQFFTLASGLESLEDYNYLNEFIKNNGIDFIYPASEEACLFLSKNQDKVNAGIISSPYETIKICSSVDKTFNHLAGHGFEMDLGLSPDGMEDHEITIDCFTDRHGVLRLAKKRSCSLDELGSTTWKIEPIDKELADMASKINLCLTFRGAWYFQINTDGKLARIFPLIAGEMGLVRNTGINLPYLSVLDLLDKDVKIIENLCDIMLSVSDCYTYRLSIMYNHVYVDFDDTLIVKGKVNAVLIMFIYQAINAGKKIYLLTRHKEDIYCSLDKYQISPKLFTKIYHIAEQPKSDYIKDSDSIFIDDSFPELNEVKQKLGIPVFNVDMVESLVWGFNDEF